VSSYTGTSAHDLVTAARTNPFDLVVAGPLTDAARIAVEADVGPVLGIAWGFDLLIEQRDAAVRERLRATLPRLARLHVDSHTLAREAEHLGMPASRITVAPWGIDTDLFRPGLPSPADSARGSAVTGRIVFSTRSWEPMYDVPTVVRGFAEARQTRPDLRLVLGGQGSQAGAVRALIHELRLDDVTEVPGSMSAPEVLAWLRRSAVYVSASHSDGTSLSLLEAMAVGVPCVASEVGRVFPVGDPHSLAEAIGQQLAAPRTQEAARRRREIVLTRGDWSRNRLEFLAGVELAMREGR
jgi:glycosyltransferase involved in cell wall biosynthesis